MKVKLRLRRLIVLLLSTAIIIPNLSITTLAATTDISYLDKYGSCEIANSYIKDGVFFLTDKDESVVTGNIYRDESAVAEADFDTWYDKALQNIKDIGIEEFNTLTDKLDAKIEECDELVADGIQAVKDEILPPMCK